MSDNPFQDPTGLHFELVDGETPAVVHKSIKGVRVNGLDITKYVEHGGVTITTDRHDATVVQVRFLAASVKTVNE
ncbi:hypothetical protein SEA_LOZINAK_129 [Gordonia phage Lozinak]|uniref:Uncharacterized protein n=2 Tax=Smoothievirus smoothie TaxID=1982561 RepID=A0A2D1GFY3_9CAUD|nr:hypothetical protein BEN60_gp077 [Gordonia phage Smoothie]ANA86286.1 hypothetical protein PBI_SMOOTHIE_130 [Gordonia phage Smoothie]ATN90755.1 hypothetical protein SEA_LOZINAK_129 [Gordonia phage Lozinak]